MAKKRNVLFIALFAGALFLTVTFISIYIFASLMIDRDVTFGDSVGVVDITGEIYYNRNKIREIENYRDNSRIKAVVIHINSPGGGVAASQELYHSIKKLSMKKPVVACMGDMAASGGYYVACAADSIIALEGTITGSIGVIATFLHTQELYHKIGLEVTVVKSGKYKDIGSPYRKMSKEEKAYIGRLLDQVYEQFINAVSESRNIPYEKVRELAQGRLYSGAEALQKGLVDRIGTYEDAVALAASMGGIKGKPNIVRKRPRRSLLERILGKSPVKIPLASDSQRFTLKYIVP